MTQHIELDYADPVHEGFFDPIQELLGTHAGNFRITVKNETTLQIAAGTDNDQVTIAINGKYRWRTTATTAALPGGLSNGEHPVFVTGSPNNFGGPLGDPDETTDYTFGLQIKKTGETPGTALYRLVGYVTVASSKITAFRQVVSSVSGPQIENGAFTNSPDIKWARDANGNWVAELQDAVEERSFVAGDYKPTARATAPAGWLLCDGSAVSRTTYAALFAEIGTTYGAGNGTTTFNLPDWEGRGLVFKGTHADVNSLADNDGLAVGSRTPKHTHTGPSHTHSFSGTTGGPDTGATVNAGTLLGMADNVHKHNFSGTTGAAGTGATGSSFGAYGVANMLIKT